MGPARNSTVHRFKVRLSSIASSKYTSVQNVSVLHPFRSHTKQYKWSCHLQRRVEVSSHVHAGEVLQNGGRQA